jgi:two-component system cell cycle sensor histidine kinase/response regulator CckA
MTAAALLGLCPPAMAQMPSEVTVSLATMLAVLVPLFSLILISYWLGRRSLRGGAIGERQLMALLDRAPLGWYAVDATGRITYMNGTMRDWLGLGEDAGEARLHELLAEVPEGASPASPFGGSIAGEGDALFRNRAGEPISVHLRQQALPPGTRGGSVACAVVHDLRPARAREAQLQVFERRFQRFFEQAPVGITLIDAEGRLEEANKAFRSMVKMRSSELRKKRLIDLIAEADRPQVEARLRMAMQGEEIGERPLDLQLAASNGRSATLYAVRREDEPGGRPGLIVQFIDTTERKKLERQFTQSQKMQAVGQLAGGIAHDFNNLLTAMIGFCDLLLLRHRAGDQSFADIMQIKQNANRAANLVRQLLAFSRQQTLIPRVLDVTDVLAELSHLLRRLIGANIELQMVHGREMFPVKVDHGQLEQVIINLAVNARDAMPEGGKLLIRTSNVSSQYPVTRGAETMPPGDYARIEVVDTGTGIAPEIIDNIFEPFFSTKEVGAGTGLGLATVYGIVKQTGGFIFVDSKVGEGTAFSIYLPRHAAAKNEAPAKQEGDSAQPRDLTGMGTVLLVEDEDAVRLFGARALRNKGYNVFEARSGEAALEMIKAGKQPIDLLITDVVMPRMDGPTLIKEVRQIRPELKVIFISGYAEDDFRKRLGEGAETHFLPKPFSLSQLAEKVKEVMRAA